MSRTHKILGALLAAIIVAGGAGWWHWTHTPQYCLSRIGAAIANHDVAEFERLVDLQSVLSRLADDALASKGVSDNAFAAGLVQMMKPMLISAATDMVRKRIESGGDDAPASPNGNEKVSGVLHRIPMTKNFEGIKYVRHEGKIATVGLEIRQPKLGITKTLDIRMREEDGHWRVAALSNFTQYTAEIEQLEKQKLEQINDKVYDETRKAFTLTRADRTTKQDRFGFERKVHFDIAAKNNGPMVRKIKGAVFITAGNNEPIQIAVDTDTPWPTGATYTWTYDKEINPFIGEEKALFETPEDQLQVMLMVDYVERDDGSILQALASLPDPDADAHVAVAQAQ